MKTLKFAIVAILLSAFGLSVNAQKFGKTPEDSLQCVITLNNYQNEYKSRNYDAALPYWRDVFKHCLPAASENFYINGVVLMSNLINKTTDKELKEARIDTLMMLYDRRIEYFPKNKTNADLLYRKAAYLERYRPDNKKDIYDAYLAAVKANKSKVDLFAAGKVMVAAREMFESNQMSIEDFTNIYTEMMDVAEVQTKAAPDDTVKQSIKAGIEGAFLTTDAANCDNLNKVLGERFAANKDDAEVVKMVVALLTTKECTTSELYYEGVEAYNKLNPSPSASYGLARMYYSKNERERAMQYFKEAVETETIAEDKSKYYQEFGGLLLKEGNVSQAISYAKQSIAANPRNGKAYLLLGTAYGGVSGCGDDEVAKRSVFWVAVDQFAKAKQLDPSLATEANKSINMYSQHFPTQADAFFLNILDGEKYQVKCGPINEWTIVRTKK